MPAYTAFGLEILSEWPLPGFLPAHSSLPPSRQLHIHGGTVPVSLPAPKVEGVLYQADAESFLLRMPGIANYLALKGEEIIVEADPGRSIGDAILTPTPRGEPSGEPPDPFGRLKASSSPSSREGDFGVEDNIRVFLLGSVLAAALIQKGFLVLHASAVEVDQRAVLFIGSSSSGKSALATAFYQRGYPLVSDEFCALTLNEDGKPRVLPGIPRIAIWEDVVKKLGLEGQNLPRLRLGLNKYILDASEGLSGAKASVQALPLSAMFFLSTHNSPLIRAARLGNLQIFPSLKDNLYHKRFLAALPQSGEHLRLLSAVVQGAPGIRIQWPDCFLLLDETASVVLQEMRP